ncbi:MAG: hypothetical protein RXQ80_09145 [Sulfolobaceae archaeon]|jgi:hypothetical protein|nr:hypothetical protein [Stygiolobus sp.]
MRIEKVEKLYFSTVYSMEEAKSVDELLSRSARALILLLRLIHLRKAKISRELGREITRFLYVEEDKEKKFERLSGLVSLMRDEAIRINYPYVDFYIQNFVSEMDRIMLTKGYDLFLTSNGKT